MKKISTYYKTVDGNPRDGKIVGAKHPTQNWIYLEYKEGYFDYRTDNPANREKARMYYARRGGQIPPTANLIYEGKNLNFKLKNCRPKENGKD